MSAHDTTQHRDPAKEPAARAMPPSEQVMPPLNGWYKPWHPRGLQCTLPLPADPVAAFAAVNAALDAGWLVQAPGLEEGEEKESVGYVLRGAFERDGKTTPFVLLYSTNDALTWSFLKVYLNRAEDVAAFEYASKLKLDKIPDYVGDDKPQRGAASKTDRFIVAAPKPFGVVFKKNPKHDDTEAGKMKPARLFVRWADQALAATQDAKPANGKPADSEDGKEHLDDIKLGDWRDWIKTISTPKDFTETKFKLDEIALPWREDLKALLAERAKHHKLAWDSKRGCFAMTSAA